MAIYTFSNVQANHTIAVETAINTYTLTASAGSNGSISSPGVTTVDYGANKTYTITPAEGYKINSVIVDSYQAGTPSEYSFLAVAANHTIAVTFALLPVDVYTVEASAGTGGSITNGGTKEITVGIDYTSVATPDDGYAFVEWLKDDVSFSTDEELTFDAGLTGETYVFEAVFTADFYTVVASAGVGGNTTHLGTNTVSTISSLTFTALPDAGYYFVQWTLDNEPYSTSASLVFNFGVADATYYLVASFAQTNKIADDWLRNRLLLMQQKSIEPTYWESYVWEPGMWNGNWLRVKVKGLQ